MSKLRHKLKDRRGFTLAELMVCVLILLLATAVIVQTLDLGILQFHRHTRQSEAQLLCNTLSLELSDQLSCASSVQKNGDGTLRSFTSGASGAEGVPCRFAEEDGKLYLEFHKEAGDLMLRLPLVSDEGYAANGAALRASLQIYCQTDGFLVDLAVTDSESTPGLGAQRSFLVKPVAAVAELD